MSGTDFLSIEPFEPHPYDMLLELGVFSRDKLPSRELYAMQCALLEKQVYAHIHRITYQSGPFKVAGLLVTPVEMKEKSHPFIMFNRGGYRSFSMLTAPTVLRYLLPLSRRNNALVFASNYRGSGGSEGQDEYCGAEVEDIHALLAIARAHTAWDGKHSLMLGWSRGTAMTFLAIRQGARMGAAAAVAGIPDFWALESNRPVFNEVFRDTMPDFDARREEHYRERSAVCWPETLNVPLLLMHGDADDRAGVAGTVKLAAMLKDQNKPHALALYPGDDHGLTANFEDVMARLSEWMMRNPES